MQHYQRASVARPGHLISRFAVVGGQDRQRRQEIDRTGTDKPDDLQAAQRLMLQMAKGEVPVQPGRADVPPAHREPCAQAVQQGRRTGPASVQLHREVVAGGPVPLNEGPALPVSQPPEN
ncbi:hypothetical protein [Parafrankia sp. FMc2]|uniref:hypothetical protein n=1 Tax=Parafrankia sp. FMc2 TaxID=3233196 RepID=UPI0034D79F52